MKLFWSAVATASVVMTAIGVCPGQRSARVPREQKRSSVCDIVGTPERFEGKRIQVWASLLSDGRHSTLLTDPKCKLGITILFPEDVSKDPDLMLLQRSLYSDRSGTLNKKITGMFFGIIRIKLKDGHRLCMLELERVADLTIKPTEYR